MKILQENFLFAEYMTHENFRKRMAESDDEVREEIREGRKKIPIRLWGINS